MCIICRNSHKADTGNANFSLLKCETETREVCVTISNGKYDTDPKKENHMHDK